ncbi:hypothetical protein ACP4OV_026210 [Aristida adscensionis]
MDGKAEGTGKHEGEDTGIALEKRRATGGAVGARMGRRGSRPRNLRAGSPSR